MPDSVYDLFAARISDAPAAHDDDRTLTYRELDDASTALAAQLVEAGVTPGARVGVLVERSVDLLVGLLGVWKAGGVYLPLDVDHPVERVGWFLADAAASAVVTRSTLAGRVPPGGPAVVALEDQPHTTHPVRRPGPRDAAYLIFTSGSTGRPKAVEVEHAALAHVVGELARILEAGPGEHWLTMAPPTFDISLAELCLPIATGAQVTVTSVAQSRDAARLVRLIRDLPVTRMQAVPSQWQALVDAGLAAPGLRGMTGGEALPARLATALTGRIAGLVNGYGPTETTIVATTWEVPADPGADGIRIGRPIAGTRVHVLDDDLAEVPLGEPGELYIAGAGVARGYAGDPALTAAAFLDDPVRGRMYRTGDRGRRRADGHLEYLGRTDSQVKIRGQRVELGEVEAGIAAYDRVGAAVAVVRGGDLVAYVVPADPADPPTPAQVRAHAAGTLTSAMTPTAVVVLQRFPLTDNGKIDRAALAGTHPEPAATPTGATLTAATPTGATPPDGPGDGAEPFTAEFCALVREVLGADRVTPGDDFFDVGGHSLAVMRVAAAIAERWHVEVASDVFYDTETVADLASAVNALRVAA